MARILIIDDEEPIRFSLRGILEDEGYEVLEAATAEEGLEVADAERPDLVFLDIWLPGMDGLTAQARLKGNHPDLPVVMISGHGTIETAVSAIQQGAYDFIEKPLSLEKVVIVAARALEAGSLRRENQVLRTVLPEQDELIGQSPVMLKFQELLARVAPTDVWVLLTGENGTGKELAARALHAGSRRADAPMIAVNCAAIPEELIESELFGHEKGAFTSADQARAGRFEMANNGTLFLDEIGDMSLKTQAKILRILQEQSFERVGGTRTIKVDVRVIAATNKNLEEAIAAGTFREDLYYRLRVVPLHLPPLRERGGDLDLLLAAFTERLCRVHACKAPVYAPETMERLRRYPWPGNVRELRNFAERMVILFGGKTVLPVDLPPEMTPQGKPEPSAEAASAACEPAFLPQSAVLGPDLDFKKARAVFEALYLEAKLHECGGNITRLAETIGLERSYLHRKLKGYGISSSSAPVAHVSAMRKKAPPEPTNTKALGKNRTGFKAGREKPFLWEFFSPFPNASSQRSVYNGIAFSGRRAGKLVGGRGDRVPVGRRETGKSLPRIAGRRAVDVHRAGDARLPREKRRNGPPLRPARTPSVPRRRGRPRQTRRADVYGNA